MRFRLLLLLLLELQLRLDLVLEKELLLDLRLIAAGFRRTGNAIASGYCM